MTKHSKSKGLLPPELARKISTWMVNIAEMTGPVGNTALIVAMALSLYGPDDHNGFLYLLGPWVCPALFSGFWSALLARRRFRIYQGSPYSQYRFVDTGDDPVVMRLAEIFNSSEARWHLWQETLRISSILFAILRDDGVFPAGFAQLGLPISGESLLFDSPGQRSGISGRSAGILVLAWFGELFSFRVSSPWKRFLPLVPDDLGQAGVGIRAEWSLRDMLGCP
jgi:hypothetical protein